MQDLTLAALPPLSSSIEIAGEVLELSPLKVGELPTFVRAIRPLAQHLGTEVDWLALFGERGDDVLLALAVAIRRPRAWVADLPLDAAIRLAEAVFEVNADFFIRRLLPSVTQAAARIGQTLESPTRGAMPSNG